MMVDWGTLALSPPTSFNLPKNKTWNFNMTIGGTRARFF